MLCPCGSKKPYAECCQPYHQGQALAPSAERLMRARYAAYVLALEDFLLKTWAKSTRPASIEFEPDIEWQKLRVVKVKQGHAEDTVGQVTFKAFYTLGDVRSVMTETSEFERDEAGAWVYLSGQVR